MRHYANRAGKTNMFITNVDAMKQGRVLVASLVQVKPLWSKSETGHASFTPVLFRSVSFL
jgi:hypothetical protein